MEFNIQTWKQSSYIVYNSLLLKIYHITSFEELRDSRSIVGKCFPAKNYELRFPSSRFPLPASQFWESAEQVNDRLLSLPNDISHLQSILAQPESSSDAGCFLLMDFKFQSE